MLSEAQYADFLAAFLAYYDDDGHLTIAPLRVSPESNRDSMAVTADISPPHDVSTPASCTICTIFTCRLSTLELPVAEGNGHVAISRLSIYAHYYAARHAAP